MKKEFFEYNPSEDGNELCFRKRVENELAPWACIVVEVEGGLLAFESWTDYETWKGQV